MGGVDLDFMDECLGGDGGRVDDECLPLVNKRETEAVAVDVPDVGSTTGGIRKEGRGRVCILGVADAGRGGCFSRIWRRHSNVRSTCRVSDVEESEEADNSSIGGVIVLITNDGEFPRSGVRDLDLRDGEL